MVGGNTTNQVKLIECGEYSINMENNNNLLGILKADSLKDQFVKKFEDLIISGEFSIGEKLPPEREIASKMGISRTIVHSGIIELAAKGLVTIQPRKGTFINDYRVDGTLAILNSLVNYNEGKINEEFFNSLMATRYMLELENAKLAALNRTEIDLESLREIINAESAIDLDETEKIINLDFNFHHRISMATGNVIYPLIIKSFELIYKNMTTSFFGNTSEIPTVFNYHKNLYNAIEVGNPDESVRIMNDTLKHGEKWLRSTLNKKINLCKEGIRMVEKPKFNIKEPKNLSPRVLWLRNYFFEGVDRE